MSRIIARRVASTTARAALGLGVLVLSITQAGAASPGVRSACASDYFAYCSQHDPDGRGVRQCMRANGLRLSPACVNALVAAGEVSKKEVARRASEGK